MPSWTVREFVVSPRSKAIGKKVSPNSALAGFASRFVKALGPMEDPLNVSEVLGKLGPRDADPAARRRAIAARIAVLSLGADAMPPQAEIMAADPEPIAVPAPLAAPKVSDPAVKKPPKTKIVKTIVALEDTAVLLDAIAISDKVKKVTNPVGVEYPATEDTLGEPQNFTDGFDDTNPLAQATESTASVATLFEDQESTAQPIDLDDASQATIQTTSKALNFATDLAVPPGMLEQSSDDGQIETEEAPAMRASSIPPNAIRARRPSSQAYVADAKPQNIKRRGKQTISFDVSALSKLRQDYDEEPKAPASPARATEANSTNGLSDRPDPPGGITPKRT